MLTIINRIGVDGGTGHVIEYRGDVIRALSMEGRMTVCNMTIEGGARAGLVAPDETTFDYLRGRPHAPDGDAWDEALASWRQLPSDPGARFDREVVLDGAGIDPYVTWGVTPAQSVGVGGQVPDPAEIDDRAARETAERALRYMDLANPPPASWTSTSTASSSAPAPTPASRTCARPRR